MKVRQGKTKTRMRNVAAVIHFNHAAVAVLRGNATWRLTQNCRSSTVRTGFLAETGNLLRFWRGGGVEPRGKACPEYILRQSVAAVTLSSIFPAKALDIPLYTSAAKIMQDGMLLSQKWRSIAANPVYRRQPHSANRSKLQNGDVSPAVMAGQ